MNILIVGLGSIAKKHIGAIRKLVPEAEIYALRSHKGADVYQNVRNVYELDFPEGFFDFAIISNPTSEHARTVEELLELNIPLFIEKPVFGSLGYDGLVEKVSDRGILNYVACNLRFLDCVQFMKGYVTSHPERGINEVNAYCGSYLPDWRPGTDYRKCYSARPELGGGVNIDLIHEIDYVYWIFGAPVDSMGVCRSVSTLDIDAVDYANYMLFYPRFTASIVLNYYRRDYKRFLEIVFEDDTWRMDLAKNEIVDSKGNVIFSGNIKPIDTYERQMAYFLQLLSENKKAENNVVEAYDVLKICLKYERPQG